jgi:hypothetical protein
MYDVIDKKYRVENIALTGADASNYRLSTNVLEGTDGRINQRPILYIPATKLTTGQIFLKQNINEILIMIIVSQEVFSLIK